ncbi:CCDC90 family protein [Mycoavidus sp. SF9855]|uniref:CCDC90 family protein n=1 Tax=Mycoavidus sp. SF9855 TaxID=2968475 RepID=UPI00211CF2C0|nr:CCDC90 family protein [Mycoavidus sp. SF9855]UUM21461.1 CCDC90 family protein [Mycoavidus sp. SF9855]
MFVTAFDTLKLVKRLIGIGASPAQAEAGVEILAEIFDHNLRELATKEDLQCEINGLRKDIDVKHESLRKDMDIKHESLRKDMDIKHESLRKDMDTKHESLRKDTDTKHESLRKDMDTKHETLRKDMDLMAERFDSKLEKFGLNLTIKHGLITAAIISAASALNKIF